MSVNTSSSNLPEIASLSKKIESASLPEDLLSKAKAMLIRAELILSKGGYFYEVDRIASYIDWITSLPWSKESTDNLDLKKAWHILDKNHYGLKEIKDRILEYLAVLTLKQRNQDEGQQMRAPILCFVGLVGTGKTTLASSIARAMNRQFARIPFGGMGDATVLRGQSPIHGDSEPGQIIKALRRAETRNPVILLDELDRVSDDAWADIMGVLVELLDPEQNVAFVDHYIDYPFDLTHVLFIATANNTSHISTAVLDRLEPIQMSSYSDEEKIAIGRDYVLPRIMTEAALTKNNLTIDNDLWPQIVRPLGFDAGIRTLERTINQICRKVARLIVEGKGESFTINKDNLKEFIATW